MVSDTTETKIPAPRTSPVRVAKTVGLPLRALGALFRFVRREPALSAAAAAAVVTAFFVPPDAEYIGYIDFRVIGLLFCLMTIVAGLVRTGIFAVLSARLTALVRDARPLAAVFCALAFLCAMLVTNDVALIMLVPLTIGLMRTAGTRAMIVTVTLETVAANLGSMVTPFGNPQNIYLYSSYTLSPQQFFGAVLPPAALSVLLIVAGLLLVPKGCKGSISDKRPSLAQNKRLLTASSVLFAAAVLSVLRILDWRICLALTIAVYLPLDRRVLAGADFGLLATFVMFFIFSGNLARIGPLRELLMQTMDGREIILSAAASQIISNVPAAVMLSGFTSNAHALLIGTNIGGLGTPVASLASLISMRFYFLSEGAARGKYIATFLAINFTYLAILLAFTFIVRY